MSKVNNATKGFTIIELLIATTVFSVILLICANGLLQIGRTYYKGITASRTQEVARTAMDDISRSIQFTGGTVSATTGALPQDRFCVGTKRFTFLKNRQLNDVPTGTQRKNILVTDTYSPTVCDMSGQSMDMVPNSLVAGSRELLSPNMRLAKLDVIDTGDGLYSVNIRVVYGDDDLLCSPSTPGDCTSSAVSTSLSNNDVSCKSIRTGTEFCAVSELNTVVKKRVK